MLRAQPRNFSSLSGLRFFSRSAGVAPVVAPQIRDCTHQGCAKNRSLPGQAWYFRLHRVLGILCWKFCAFSGHEHPVQVHADGCAGYDSCFVRFCARALLIAIFGIAETADELAVAESSTDIVEVMQPVVLLGSGALCFEWNVYAIDDTRGGVLLAVNGSSRRCFSRILNPTSMDVPPLVGAAFILPPRTLSRPYIERVSAGEA